MNSRFGPFLKTRLILTLWYSWIILLILMVFSIFLYTAQNRDFTRIVVQQAFGNRIPRILTANEVKDLNEQIDALRYSFIINIIVIDGILLFLGGGLGYLLAGKTLEPIQKILQSQKEFTADASHELRTPLAAIQTTAEVALRSKNRTKDDYQNVLSQIHQESLSMKKLLDDLLTLSRVESGTMKFKFTQCFLDALIEDTYQTMKPIAISRGITINIVQKEKTIVWADKDKIKQLLVILIDNAIKYTPKNGQIDLSVVKRPKPLVSIRDTGIGITPSDTAHIFERFYQADKARTGDGAGLGLSIASWIATMHNAKISVKSKKGEGSTFIVQFS